MTRSYPVLTKSCVTYYLINANANCWYERCSCWENLGKAGILLFTYIMQSFTQKQWALEMKSCELLQLDYSLNSQFRVSS